MAVPKKKLSQSRQNSRRANWKLTAPKTVVCPNCREPKLTHAVCPTCGHYKGRAVVVEPEKTEGKKA